MRCLSIVSTLKQEIQSDMSPIRRNSSEDMLKIMVMQCCGWVQLLYLTSRLYVVLDKNISSSYTLWLVLMRNCCHINTLKSKHWKCCAAWHHCTHFVTVKKLVPDVHTPIKAHINISGIYFLSYANSLSNHTFTLGPTTARPPPTFCVKFTKSTH